MIAGSCYSAAADVFMVLPSNHMIDEAKVSKKRPASAMDELSDSSASSWPEEEDDDDYDGY